MGRGGLFWCIIVTLLAFAISCSVAPEQAVDLQESPVGEQAKVRAQDPVHAQDVSRPAATPRGPKPNILLITIDTLRADHLGAYGNTRMRTPTLDALAQKGARFDMEISQFSQTNPSHASILTGAYAATHKVMIHGVDKLAGSVTTLAEVLAGQGYSTAGIYSWPSLDPGMSGLDRGFQTYRAAYFEVPDAQQQKDFWRKWSGRADVTNEAVLRYFAGKPSQPYFLWVHYQDPHYPFVPMPPFDNMYEPRCPTCAGGGYNTVDKIYAGGRLSELDVAHVVAQYDGSISFTDQEIGKLLAKMEEENLLDNTMIIVTGDHGEAFDENGRWFHPLVLYNSVLRVPLIIRYAPAVPEGRVIDAVTRGIDIMPTILDLVGVRYPKGLEGQSLWPLIDGEEKGNVREAITQVHDNSAIVIVAGEWKLIRDNTNGELGLYNLKTDPREMNNLASSNHEQATALENRLKAWMKDHGIDN